MLVQVQWVWTCWIELLTCRAVAEKLLCWQAPKSCLDMVREAIMVPEADVYLIEGVMALGEAVNCGQE